MASETKDLTGLKDVMYTALDTKAGEIRAIAERLEQDPAAGLYSDREGAIVAMSLHFLMGLMSERREEMKCGTPP